MSERCDAPTGGSFGAYSRCTRPAWDGAGCPFCRTSVFWCRKEGHEEAALAGLEGHKLLHHPEVMPDVVMQVARDPVRLQMVREGVAKMPEQYAKLVAALESLGVRL